MKKLFTCVLTAALILSCLTACDLFTKDNGITIKEYENCAVFTFADFPEQETASFALPRTGLGEGTIYYQVNLEEGALSISYKDTGIIHEKQPLGEFTADDEMPINGSGGYIEGDKISIQFEALSPVSGEIIIAFNEDALKAVHGNLHLHQHTYSYTSVGKSGHYTTFTCGCPSEEGTTPHYDSDTDYRCDYCKCDMTEFADEWQYDETHHWYVSIDGAVYCYGEHENRNGGSSCDICGYRLESSTESPDVAQIVLDYEQSLRDELDRLRADHPENNYYYHSVDYVECALILDTDASADDIVAKHDMDKLFANADVSPLNVIKMISIIFERDEFTEDMHQKVKQLSDDEALIEGLFINMSCNWRLSYMPRIEYYTDDAKAVSYKESQPIGIFNGKDAIFRSKNEYDAYLDELLASAEYDYEKEKISAARDLYDEAFFEENALIITRMITRGSGSTKLTVNNLYVSDNKLYVVIRTDIPTWVTDDMQYAFFGFAVNQSDVLEVNEVITLD